MEERKRNIPREIKASRTSEWREMETFRGESGRLALPRVRWENHARSLMVKNSRQRSCRNWNDFKSYRGRRCWRKISWIGKNELSWWKKRAKSPVARRRPWKEKASRFASFWNKENISRRAVQRSFRGSFARLPRVSTFLCEKGKIIFTKTRMSGFLISLSVHGLFEDRGKLEYTRGKRIQTPTIFERSMTIHELLNDSSHRSEFTTSTVKLVRNSIITIHHCKGSTSIFIYSNTRTRYEI